MLHQLLLAEKFIARAPGEKQKLPEASGGEPTSVLTVSEVPRVLGGGLGDLFLSPSPEEEKRAPGEAPEAPEAPEVSEAPGEKQGVSGVGGQISAALMFFGRNIKEKSCNTKREIFKHDTNSDITIGTIGLNDSNKKFKIQETGEAELFNNILGGDIISCSSKSVENFIIKKFINDTREKVVDFKPIAVINNQNGEVKIFTKKNTTEVKNVKIEDDYDKSKIESALKSARAGNTYTYKGYALNGLVAAAAITTLAVAATTVSGGVFPIAVGAAATAFFVTTVAAHIAQNYYFDEGSTGHKSARVAKVVAMTCLIGTGIVATGGASIVALAGATAVAKVAGISAIAAVSTFTIGKSFDVISDIISSDGLKRAGNVFSTIACVCGAVAAGAGGVATAVAAAGYVAAAGAGAVAAAVAAAGAAAGYVAAAGAGAVAAAVAAAGAGGMVGIGVGMSTGGAVAGAAGAASYKGFKKLSKLMPTDSDIANIFNAFSKASLVFAGLGGIAVASGVMTLGAAAVGAGVVASSGAAITTAFGGGLSVAATTTAMYLRIKRRLDQATKKDGVRRDEGQEMDQDLTLEQQQSGQATARRDEEQEVEQGGSAPELPSLLETTGIGERPRTSPDSHTTSNVLASNLFDTDLFTTVGKGRRPRTSPDLPRASNVPAFTGGVSRGG